MKRLRFPPCPGRAMEAVEHLSPEGVAQGQKGMVEVVGRVVRHPDALHDSLRPHVADCREGDDLVEAEIVEAECEGCASAFGRISLAPMVAREPPADLHRRGEADLKPRLCETDEADEGCALDDFDRPQSPAPLRK